MEKHNWLALAVGNSRLHWGWFRQYTLIKTWDTQHLENLVEPSHLPHFFLPSDFIKQGLTSISVYLASVAADRAKYWQNYRDLTLINLQDIKLTNIYPTLGIDRALAAWGAIAIYDRACLVIDGGTALTFTGVDQQRKLIGGAILPGLRSQLLTLQQKTSALPEVELPHCLPTRWALDTDTAIASGVIYTAIASIHSYITDWLRQFPDSQVIFTGGDAEVLVRFLHQQFPELAWQTTVDRNLIFQGIRLVYEQRQNKQ